MYLEAQGVYNKAVFNIAQSALEKAKTSVAQIREKISSLIPEGKDYFYDAEGVLKIADSKEAALLAKEAYFHKNISQIEADNKAIEEFSNKLSNLFSDSDKAQVDEIFNLSQKRISPQRLLDASNFIGLDEGKTDEELVENIISYVEKRKGNVSDSDAKKILDCFKQIGSVKIKEQETLTKKLKNAQSRLATDKNIFAAQEETFKSHVDKITKASNVGDLVEYKSLDGITHQEVAGETIRVAEEDIKKLCALEDKYSFLNAQDIHAQHRLFGRFGGATSDGGAIDEKGVIEILDKIQDALNLPADKLLEGLPDEKNPTPKLGIFLSNGNSSRGAMSLLLPASDGGFENVILDRNAKLVTVISDVSAASVKKNFVPAAQARAIIS